MTIAGLSVAPKDMGLLVLPGESLTSGVALQNITFTQTIMGTFAPNPARRIVVAVWVRDAASVFSISSATISGVAATVVQSASAVNSIKAALLQAAVPNNSGGNDIVVNFSEAITSNVRIEIFFVYGTKVGVVDTDNAEATGSTGLTRSLQRGNPPLPGLSFVVGMWDAAVTLTGASDLHYVNTAAYLTSRAIFVGYRYERPATSDITTPINASGSGDAGLVSLFMR